MDIKAKTDSGGATGRTTAILELARSMKSKGLDTVAIAEITRLSAEEIGGL